MMLWDSSRNSRHFLSINYRFGAVCHKLVKVRRGKIQYLQIDNKFTLGEVKLHDL